MRKAENADSRDQQLLRLMNVRVELGTSPIFELVEPIAHSLILIAPERVDEIRPLVTGLVMEITDESRARCEMDSSRKIMRLSRGLLEHLWASAYAYWILYSRPDLTQDPVDSDAMRLLRWTIENAVSHSAKPWPADLPRPSSNPRSDSDIHAANELMLSAVAFLLHHELAHFRLGHGRSPAGPDSIQQEREADYEAVRWILEGCPKADFEKRALAAAIAFCTLINVEVHRGPRHATTHPASYDRLINSLQRHIDDPHHAAWGLAIIIMKLHMDSIRVDAPDRSFASARELAEDYANILADRLRTA
jgi:hypothetical protein